MTQFKTKGVSALTSSDEPKAKNNCPTYLKVVCIENAPPFRLLLPFIEQSLKCASKVAMFCQLQALEDQKRCAPYRKNPPARIYVFADRVACSKDDNLMRIMCFCWMIWERGFNGKPTIDWILTKGEETV